MRSLCRCGQLAELKWSQAGEMVDEKGVLTAEALFIIFFAGLGKGLLRSSSLFGVLVLHIETVE